MKDLNVLPEQIAIVGMACKFPGNVSSPKEFFEFLLKGGDGITLVPSDRWDHVAYYDADKEKKNRMYVNQGGFLSDIDLFEPQFFGISPKEAPSIDPQHRWLLELTYEALENAGLKPSALRGSNTAVYMGQFMHDYEQLQVDAMGRELISSHSATGPSMTLTANRISYTFDFTGPSVALDTACSSSLVALDMACQAIARGDSDVALAGGVNILLRPEMTMSICKASMLSADGRCKSFDASANGYVRSEGAGVVVIKRYSDAVRDGDPILAIIKGSGVNQDGQTNGITVPNGNAQKRLLQTTLARAQLVPADIQYLEAHGTGTAVGDPIEVNAMGSLLREQRSVEHPCVIGSVKSNIGHTEAAAGMAGLMKTVLAMNAGVIPRNIHFKKLNPAISLTDLNFSLAVENTPWPDTQGQPRRALINSFGFGGTNANVIIEAATVENNPLPASNLHRKYWLPLSAKSEMALKALAQKFQQFLEQCTDNQHLLDICYTAALRRDHYKYRLVVTGKSPAELNQALASFLAGEQTLAYVAGVDSGKVKNNKTAFVFSGMGTQWVGMGRELYAQEPVFKNAMDRCDAALLPLTGWSLVDQLYINPEPELSNRTDLSQPAIFAVQYALVELLASWNIRPSMIVGHSAGEVAAAYASGALSFDDAIAVIYHRSRLQFTTEGMGKMLAVGLREGDLAAYLRGVEDKVSIAAINSDDAITLAGSEAELKIIAEQLDEKGIFARFLNVSVPYHSPVMDHLKAPLIEALADIKVAAPVVPIYSTVSGVLSRDGDWGAEYWAANVRQPVLFKTAIESMIADGAQDFIEISAHPALASSIEKILKQQRVTGAIIPCLKRDLDAIAMSDRVIGLLYSAGISPDWQFLYAGGRHTLLPNYTWQKSRYWSEDEAVRYSRLNNVSPSAGVQQECHLLLGSRLPSQVPIWQKTIRLDDLAFLADHRVDGDIVYPAAAYIDMALALAAECGKDGAVTLENLAFHRALFLNEDSPQRMETLFDSRSGRYQIGVQEQEGAGWALFSDGKISDIIAPRVKQNINVESIKAGLPSYYETEEFYAHCLQLGLDYRERFQAVTRAWFKDDESLVEINLPESLVSQHESHRLNPAILDGAFQGLFPTISSGYLPVGIRQFRYHRMPGTKGYAHLITHFKNQAEIYGDLLIADEAGEVVVEILGISLKAISIQEINAAELLYEFGWRETPAESLPAKSGTVLVVADRSGVHESVCRHLRESNRDLVLFDTDKPNEWDELLKVHGSSCSAILYLPTLDLQLSESMAAGDIMASIESGACFPMLAFAQAVVRREWEHELSLLLVTERAQWVNENDDQLSILQSALWGFGRVFGSEHSELSVGLIDLDDRNNERCIAALLDELNQGGREQEVAIRSGRRFVNRLQRINDVALNAYAARDIHVSDIESFKVITGSRPALERSLRAPVLQSGQVVVQTHYAAIGSPGWVADNQYLCAGDIISVGSAVQQFSVGDKVLVATTEVESKSVLSASAGIVKIPASVSLDRACSVASEQLWAAVNLDFVAQHNDPKALAYVGPLNDESMALLRQARAAGLHVEACSADTVHFEALEASGVVTIDKDNFDWAECIGASQAIDVLVYADNSPLEVRLLQRLQLFSLLLDWSQVAANLESFDIIQQRNINYLRLNWSDLLNHRRSLIALCIERVMAQESQPVADTISIDQWLVAEASSGHRTILDFEPELEEPRLVKHGQCTPVVNGNGTYLVTGGLGGLGLAMMDWLVNEGARSIALIGRSAPNEFAQDAIARAQATGATIKVLKGDVTNDVDVDAIIREINANMVPLRGIIHSAGVLDDGVIAQQTPEKFSRVLASKVKGTWNLHQATLGIPLDMFVCFSSIAAVVGWPGQSNYASANSFMDSFCRYRQQLGLPALSVNWGPWAEVGMASKLETRDIERMESSGMKALEPQAAVAAMKQLLVHGVSHAGVFAMDWRLVFKNSASLQAKALLSEFVEQNDSDSPRESFASLYAATANDMRAELVQEKSCMILAETLGFENATQIDINTNLFEYGMNSLMAMDCKNRLQEFFGVRLPATLLLKYPTVAGFSEQCYKLLETSLAISSEVNPAAAIQGNTANNDEAFLIAKEIDMIRYHHGREKDLAHFTLPVSLEIDVSRVDMPALEKSFQWLVAQNEALRLRVSLDGGFKFLIAANKEKPTFIRIELDPGKEETLAAICNSLIANAFNFTAEDPLAKPYLLVKPEGNHVTLLIVFHHWIVDGMGLQLIKQQLMENYYKILAGQTEPGDEQQGMYQRFVANQKAHVQSDAGKTEIRYWLEQPWDQAASIERDDSSLTAAQLLPPHKMYLADCLDKLWAGNALSPTEKLLLAEQNVAFIPANEQFANFERVLNRKGLSLEDAVVYAITDVLHNWLASPIVLAGLFRSGRTNDLFGDETLASVGDWHYSCPLFVEQVTSEPFDQMHAISQAKLKVPAEGLSYPALKYFSGNSEMEHQKEPQICINFTQRDFLATSEKTLEGIQPLDLDMVRNAPTLFADDRIYFEIGYRKNNFYIKTVVKGFDYMDSLFAGYFHPARSIALSEAIKHALLQVIESDAVPAELTIKGKEVAETV